MHDTELTRQSLPSDRYRLLLGTAISVFNSNNGFIIENVLRIDDSKTWHALIDRTSGSIKDDVNVNLPGTVADLFGDIVDMRNRIIHAFRITNKDDEQVMATKEKSGQQCEITEDYLLDFIRKNEDLSDKLHEFRGYQDVPSSVCPPKPVPLIHVPDFCTHLEPGIKMNI